MKKTTFLIWVLLALLLPSCSHSQSPEYNILRLRDGAKISFSQMIGELKGTNFIFVGEIHSSMKSHEAQLKVIKELHKRGQPLAVGLEMFWAKSQPQLDQWIAGNLGEADFIRLYYRDWRMPWPYYRDIFRYLKKQRIPMVGLNIPRTVSEKVANYGAASLTKEELNELPPGLSCDVSPAYKDYIRQVFTEHANPQDDSFQNFCEAQVLWDKVMAWHLVEYEKKNSVPVVVLCGLVHSLRRGIPSRVKELRKNYTCRIIIPQVPGIDTKSITAKLADYLILD